ncbi:MAG: cupin domain-containing protein [Ferruginibacter sp.]
MKIFFFFLLLIPFSLFAQQDSVQSGAYEWKTAIPIDDKISNSILLEGTVHDFKWMQVNSSTITSTKKFKQQVPPSYEQVIILKSGSLKISFNDSTYELREHSVAVLMPGQKFTIRNTGNGPAAFFCMKYTSKNPADARRSNRSFVKTWENIPFKPNNNGGGRRDFFEQSTPMQKRFEMHVTTLKEGLKSHEPHTHRAEEIVWILEGETEMQLGDGIVKKLPHGFYYLGSNVPHAIKNIGTKPATYFAFQFE